MNLVLQAMVSCNLLVLAGLLAAAAFDSVAGYTDTDGIRLLQETK